MSILKYVIVVTLPGSHTNGCSCIGKQQSIAEHFPIVITDRGGGGYVPGAECVAISGIVTFSERAAH